MPPYLCITNMPGDGAVTYPSQMSEALIPYKVVSDTYNYYEVRNYINDVNRTNTQVLSSYDEKGDTREVYTYGNERLNYSDGKDSFLSEDSYLGTLMEPLSRNLYTYTENNPVNFDDPSGHGIFSGIKKAVGKAVKNAFHTAKKVFHTVKKAAVQTWNKATAWVGNTVNTVAKQRSGGYYGSESGSGGGSYYVQNAYERAKRAGKSIYNWGRSKLKEAGNIWKSWTASIEKTVKHFCTTANATKKQNFVGTMQMFNTAKESNIKYDREAAVEYAKRYSDAMQGLPIWIEAILGKVGIGRNSNYYSYSTNCANFVSQSLEAGGIEQNVEWYSKKKTTEHLTASGNSIYYTQDFKVSETWRLAQEQYEYFNDEKNGFSDGTKIEINSILEIESIIKKYNIQKGDLMYFKNQDGSVHHATIINRVDKYEIFFSGNTKRRYDKPLMQFIGNGVYIVHMNDFIKSNQWKFKR